jgi:hypothetical protein
VVRGGLWDLYESLNLLRTVYFCLSKRDDIPCGGVARPELDVGEDEDVEPSHPESSEMYATLVCM